MLTRKKNYFKSILFLHVFRLYDLYFFLLLKIKGEALLKVMLSRFICVWFFNFYLIPKLETLIMMKCSFSRYVLKVRFSLH